MKPLILIGLRNVYRNWRHSLASLLTIVAGFFSLNIFQGYITDTSHKYLVGYRNRGMYGDLVIVHKTSLLPEAREESHKYDLDESAQQAVIDFANRRSQEIFAVNRFLYIQGVVSNGKSSTIFFGQGNDLEESLKIRGEQWAWNTLYGAPLGVRAPEPDGTLKVDPEFLTGKATLGQGLGRLLGCKPNPPLEKVMGDGWYPRISRPFQCDNESLQFSGMTVDGQVTAIDLDVAGMIDVGYADLDNRCAYMSLQDAQKFANTKKVSLISMGLKDSGKYKTIIAAMEEEIGPRFPELVFLRWQDHPNIGDMYRKTMDLFAIFRNFVLVVIVVISGLSVLNTMTKNVTERTREIGTLLGIGFRRRQIEVIFLSEAVFLCLLGVVIGGAGSIFCAFLVDALDLVYKAGPMSQPIPFEIAMTWSAALSGIALLLGLSVVTTHLACRRALKKSIVDCLSHA